MSKIKLIYVTSGVLTLILGRQISQAGPIGAAAYELFHIIRQEQLESSSVLISFVHF